MYKQMTVIKVGIADLNIAKGLERIRTSGLGSCVGVVIYDQTLQVAGLAHIMLPDSTATKQLHYNAYKYADTAIDRLVEKLIQLQANKFRLKAKIAGGAKMFQMTFDSDVMRIGPRNVEAVKERLKLHRIPIIAEDVGGSSGRTIEFDPLTAKLKIRTVNQGEKFI